MVWVFSFLDSFELWDGLLESSFDYSLRELGPKQQRASCRFGVVDIGVYLFNLN